MRGVTAAAAVVVAAAVLGVNVAVVVVLGLSPFRLEGQGVGCRRLIGVVAGGRGRCFAVGVVVAFSS